MLLGLDEKKRIIKKIEGEREGGQTIRDRLIQSEAITISSSVYRKPFDRSPINSPNANYRKKK